MKTKLLTLITAVVAVLLTTSCSYACLTIDVGSLCYLNPDIKFMSVSAIDNELSTNIATIQAAIATDGKAINVIVTNAYPDYQAKLTYIIGNTGNCLIHFTRLTTNNPYPTTILVTTTDPTGITIKPCQTINGVTTIQILQTAQQDTEYKFQIQFTAESRESTHPRNTNFWRDRFLEQAIRFIQPKIDGASLEEYLDQISTQSNAFEFTGTRVQKFLKALNILTLLKKANAETQLKAQLLTLWLNHMAEWTAGYTIDGQTAQQVIQGAEVALRNEQSTQYGYWKNLCERFNNLT